jgi:hypothetical protein
MVAAEPRERLHARNTSASLPTMNTSIRARPRAAGERRLSRWRPRRQTRTDGAYHRWRVGTIDQIAPGPAPASQSPATASNTLGVGRSEGDHRPGATARGSAARAPLDASPLARAASVSNTDTVLIVHDQIGRDRAADVAEADTQHLSWLVSNPAQPQPEPGKEGESPGAAWARPYLFEEAHRHADTCRPACAKGPDRGARRLPNRNAQHIAALETRQGTVDHGLGAHPGEGRNAAGADSPPGPETRCV